MRRIPTLISFCGHPAGGVPVLMEHLLRSCRRRDVVSVRLEEGVAGTEVSVDRDGADFRRYHAAGASDVFRVCHARGSAEEAIVELLNRQVACRIAHGLLLEGLGATGLQTDLTVFVTRPLETGQALLEKREKEVTRLRKALARIKRILPTDYDEDAW